MRKMSDLYETYKRILKSAKRGQGTKLTASECHAMSKDDAIWRVVYEEDDRRAEATDAK
jgi:hypothetical protein